jgi:ferritin-like metal-binding protein YciE
VATGHPGTNNQTSTTMITDLKQLYFDQIRDLHSAETQLTEALPEMVSSASDSDLTEAFQSHLDETRGHLERLETICSNHGISAGGETCEAMKGLIKEGKSHIEDTRPGEVRDAVLIASGNRVEHYEIAGYGVAKSFASVLGFDDDVKLLDKTLDEESAADEKLTKLATGGLLGGGINESAMR